MSSLKISFYLWARKVEASTYNTLCFLKYNEMLSYVFKSSFNLTVFFFFSKWQEFAMNYGLDPGDCMVIINGLVIDADIADPFM